MLTMRRVAYSQAYSADTFPFRYSEYLDNHAEGEHFTTSTPHNDPAFQARINRDIKAYKETTHAHNPRFLWETSYNCAYDLEAKTLRLTTCEEWDTYNDFKL